MVSPDGDAVRLVQTKGDLTGLRAGIREAESETAAARVTFSGRRAATFTLGAEAEAEARSIARTTSALQGRMSAMTAETNAIQSRIAAG